MRALRSWKLAVAVAMALAPAPVALADTYPSRVVTIIVPQAPGGSTDVIGRTIANLLSEKWKSPVIIENVAGAAALVGTRRVAQANPDGYTLLFTYEGAQALLPHVVAKPGVDASRDFTAIATAARAGFMIVTSPKLPVETFQEYLSYVQANPDKVTYGAVTGSSNHLIMEMVKKDSKASIRHVPYRGAAQSITDLLGGQIDSVVASIPSVIGNIEGGTLRALAVTGGSRSTVAPKVPTIAESGIPGFDITHWWGVLGPARMDPKIVDRIAKDIAEIAKSDAFRNTLEKQGAEPFFIEKAEFARQLDSDIAKWGELCKQIDYKP